MNTRAPDIQEKLGLRSMMIPTIAVTGEILANCYIIWFLLMDFPVKMCPSRGGDSRATDLQSGSRRVHYCHNKRSDDSLGGLFYRDIEFPAERVTI